MNVQESSHGEGLERSPPGTGRKRERVILVKYDQRLPYNKDVLSGGKVINKTLSGAMGECILSTLPFSTKERKDSKKRNTSGCERSEKQAHKKTGVKVNVGGIPPFPQAL